MRPIKFRQRNGDRWHYWGFIDDAFITPCRYDTPSQQFTGLTDRNGVEVFEGDIINPNHEIKTRHYRPKEVKWVNSRYRIGFNIGGSETECEVIGNIYENPELLR